MRHARAIFGGLVVTSVCFVGRAEAAGTEIPLVNPGFEADGTGVASPTGWQSAGNVNTDYTEAGGHTGSFQLTHWSSSAYSVDTSQTVKRLANGWYTMKAWVRRSTGANNSYITLDCGQGPQAPSTYVPAAWNGQWLQIVVSAQSVQGSCTLDLHTDAAGGEWTNFDDIELVTGQASLSIAGADVSSLNKSVAFGGVYNDDESGGNSVCAQQLQQSQSTQPCDEITKALAILKEHGTQYIRLRVWVNPADGYHNQAEILNVSQHAHALGLKVLVDFHYSDTWADPGHQAKPAAWANYTVPQLTQAVYDHTYGVVSAMTAQGTPPDMVQIGNEINSGILFPDGSTWNPPNWSNLAGFLNAGATAVKAAAPQAKVMFHLANGGDNGGARWWFDNITSLGVPFDVIGFSYYGYWHGSVGDLQANLNDVSARYNKDVVVVETAYPFTLQDDNPDGYPNDIGEASQLVAGYPATTDGQSANLRDVLSIVRAVPNGHGLGAFYWDATWTEVPGNGWDPTNPTSDNNWENQALFDFTDTALPAMHQLHL
jgi:arabinogalactan endo-1,4-beta-galactosidase